MPIFLNCFSLTVIFHRKFDPSSFRLQFTQMLCVTDHIRHVLSRAKCRGMLGGPAARYPNLPLRSLGKNGEHQIFHCDHADA